MKSAILTRQPERIPTIQTERWGWEIARSLEKLNDLWVRLRRIRIPNPVYNVVLMAVGISPILFQTGSMSAQALYAGYDPIRNAVSALVLSPYGWLQTAVFYLFGAALIALAIIVYFRIKARFKAGVIGMILLGAAFTVLGANPTAGPGISDLTAAIHRGAAVFVVTAFPVMCFTISPMFKNAGHKGILWYTVAAGTFATAFMIIGGIFLAQRQSMVGLFERVLLLNGQIWVIVVATQMITSKSQTSSADRSTPIAIGAQDERRGDLLVE
jgi:hypothetical protein